MRSATSFLLIGVVFGALFVSCDSFAPNEVWALTSFKEAIFEDPFSVFSDWNGLDADPCDWSGIYCSLARDHVIKLNISSSSLKGFLAPELGLLSSLQELILHDNNLLGIIPKDVGMLKNLKLLDLGKNRLTGPIPPEIGNLTTVISVNLESNGLTGRLPAEFSNLKYLEELRLDRNRLQGTFPGSDSPNFSSSSYRMYAVSVNNTGFCNTQLKVADFSYNFFIGSIPKCLDYLPRMSFQGNCFHDGDIKQRPTAQCASAGASPLPKSHLEPKPKYQPPEDIHRHHGESKPAWLLGLEVVTGTMVGSLLVFAVFTSVQRCKSKPSIIIPWKKSAIDKDHMTVFTDSEMLKDVFRFSRQELEVACEDFSNIIGSSPDSIVYKGTMRGGPEIAVISLCIKKEQWTRHLELYFQQEVADLARLNHENTGKLLGYCRESSPFTRMLVFEYASNGTLYEHLHYGDGCQLTWPRRMKIVLGIARGLKYLHTEIEPPFTISELNSSAVYLTEDFSPKLVDFESWKTILARSEKNSSTIGNEGAVCVLPHMVEGRHLDIHGNTYAFGVLLLEIISGRPPYCKDKGCLVDWAKDFIQHPEVMSLVVDPELEHFSADDLKVVSEVVCLCLQQDASKLPSMQELCDVLESKINISLSAELKSSSLAWAELALSS
ncbi:Serine-threonine/tyrosine-protein kinase, catalytic domain [Dillenia turbinata]|uniref:Serine-threonine/tyrosine-protein kinase, catalytic domain n=1 Tax=Dillenia turbinata TaxID=194707 RepID=A0AAN8ZUX6_9MAGN